MEEQGRTRLRLTFGKGEALKYISHLDLARTWERAFRRAGLPLLYSQGFNPRPRFQIAAALPVGVTGQAELMDVWLAEPLAPAEVLDRLRPTLPPGLAVTQAERVELSAPSLQSQMRVADYRVVVHSPEPAEAIRARMGALLEAPALLRQRQHKGRLQTYDLRPLIQGLDVAAGGPAGAAPTGAAPGRGPGGGAPPGGAPPGGGHVLVMRLQASPQGAGRPDEVLDALGLSLAPHSVERTNLHFEFDN